MTLGGLAQLAVSVVPAADSISADQLRTSIVIAMGGVLAATIPALLGRRSKPPRQDSVTQQQKDARDAQRRLVAELTKDRDDEKRTAQAAVRGIELRDHEIDRLRRLVQQLGGDPFPPRVQEDRHD